VVYAPDLVLLDQTLRALNTSVLHAKKNNLCKRAELWLVDNGPAENGQTALHNLLQRPKFTAGLDNTRLLDGQGNVGYGAGHNIAIFQSTDDFHLVLNPDALLAVDALAAGLRFMVNHAPVGLLVPAVQAGDGQPLYLCKRYPAVLDLLLRGFAPDFVKALFRCRLERYEMRDLIGEAPVFDPPLVSGCCMLFRRVVLQEIRGFDKTFFLYFEDFDLSLRLAKVARIAYLPAMRITHFGGHTARKGWRHIALFLRSAVLFYVRYGWKWL